MTVATTAFHLCIGWLMKIWNIFNTYVKCFCMMFLCKGEIPDQFNKGFYRLDFLIIAAYFVFEIKA